ncbi:MAG: anti-anti-sigma factor [Marmoricola sp.]|nr:anti-anti-sigma factor [Marmoricola sp.]
MSTIPQVTYTDQGAAAVVRPVGEFDINETDQLRSAFVEAISATRPRVVVDLSLTTFLDSMALGAIVGAHRRAVVWGGWVCLVAPPANVLKVLRITKLDTVLPIYDTVDQALGHGRGTSQPSAS